MTAIPPPELPTHGGASGKKQRRRCCRRPSDDVSCLIVVSAICIVIGCAVLTGLCLVVYTIWSNADEAKPPRYHVAVDGVAGLDPSAVLSQQRRATLDPEFNLTVGLASRSFTRGRCFHDGSAVRVYYGGVQLAGEALPSLCAGPRRSAERASVVAWGSGVRVPRLVRGALARDLRRGAAEFDVALTVMKPREDGWQVVTCKVEVGQAAAASPAPCAVSVEDAPWPRTHKDADPVSYGFSPAPDNGGAD